MAKRNGKDKYDRAIERELGNTPPQRHIDFHGSEPRGFYEGQESQDERRWQPQTRTGWEWEERRGSRRRPEFTGVGPKGYGRSNESIREEICERLTTNPYIDPSDVEIEVEQRGIVRLKGTVQDRWTKRVIESECDEVRGVRDVRNELEIREL